MKKHSLLFWDLLSKRYAKQPIADEESYQKKLLKTREYLKPHMEVFEFGCGTGSTAITHAPNVKHIHATDGSAKMIDIGKEKAEALNLSNVTFECATIDDFDTPAEKYDVVLGLSILHLLKNREEAISKVHKMLKPGGVFITSTICMGDDMKYAKFIAPVGRLFGLVLKVFTARELKKNFTDAGFTIDHEWQPEGKNKSVFLIMKK